MISMKYVLLACFASPVSSTGKIDPVEFQTGQNKINNFKDGRYCELVKKSDTEN